MRIVKPTGPTDAKIAIVGEAPGKDEDATGMPFVGASGRLLNRLLRSVGIRREECYITNVVKVKPPENKIERIGELGLSLSQCTEELREELSKNSHNVIVPLGNVALTALTGKESITKQRGSILKSSILENQKVIPTIHPAAALRMYSSTALMTADFSRIKAESEFPDFRSLVEREFILDPSYVQVIDELDRLIEEATYISFDLETNIPPTYIKCLGIAASTTEAISIPLVHKKKIHWLPQQEEEIWKRVNILLTSKKYLKVIQNTTFEYPVTYPWVGEIHPIYMDTMVAMKTCYPELKKGLATICSLFTTEPYYKDDGKAGGSEGMALWKYNCLDVCVTLEAAFALEKELEEFGMYDFFHGYVMPSQALYTRGSKIGVKTDVELMESYYNITTKKCYKKQQVLDALVGWPINVNSPPKVKKYMYKELELKTVKVRKGVGIADEDTIIKLIEKNPQYKIELQLILDVRQMSKLLSTYLGGRQDKVTRLWSFHPELIVDPDGRIRSTQTVGGTETGRLSASQNPFGRGCNTQNQPKYIRRIFVADEGHVFVVGDLRQVEARDVAYLSGDIGLKSIFDKGGDIHREVASWVHKVPAHIVTASQRQECKHVVHGANYAIGPFAFTTKVNEPFQDGAWLLNHPDDLLIGPNDLLKRGNITMKAGKWLLEQFHNAFPGVRSWHRSIVDTLISGNINRPKKEKMTLISPFGRRRTFFGWWGDDLFRAAYANIPQGMAGDLINMAAIRIDQRVWEVGTILLQVHDELVIQTPEESTSSVAKIFKEEVELPYSVNGEDLVIPLEINVGKNWKDTDEWSEDNGEV